MPAKAHWEEIIARLRERTDAGIFRSLPDYSGLVDFCSNDYLGFAKSFGAETVSLQGWGGSTGSRLISGNHREQEAVEAEIAAYHGEQAALVFSSGYQANLGLLACLGNEHDVFYCDEYLHASAIDGLRLNKAVKQIFRHNDVHHLRELMQTAKGKKWVIIESVYSMDGDLAPLNEIHQLCEAMDAALIVDEAHATGVFGKEGKGLVNACGLEGQVFARMHSFGKALGLHGAAILGNEPLKAYLINYARSFIFSTAPPPALFRELKNAYARLPNAPLEVLNERIAYFHQQALQQSDLRWRLNKSPIQLLYRSEDSAAASFSAHLLKQGFAVKWIQYPTVPKGKERLRICLHAFNTPDEIDGLLNAIKYFES